MGWRGGLFAQERAVRDPQLCQKCGQWEHAGGESPDVDRPAAAPAFNHLGYAWARDALMAAFPEAVREELRKSDNERTHANVVEASPPRRTKARTKTQTGAAS